MDNRRVPREQKKIGLSMVLCPKLREEFNELREQGLIDVTLSQVAENAIVQELERFTAELNRLKGEVAVAEQA